MVIGHWVKLSPAKTTMPILSYGLWAMNSMAISLAALSLSGLKSRASILVDTSMASIMSIPSESTLSTCPDVLGLAIAMIISTMATVLNINGTCLTAAMTECPVLIHGIIVDTLRCGRLSFSSIYR